jgi:hypothetical protein
LWHEPIIKMMKTNIVIGNYDNQIFLLLLL